MVTQESARWSRRSPEIDTAAHPLKLARTYTAEGRLEQADAACTDALRQKIQHDERDKDLATIFNTRAAIRLERGMPVAARQDATEAIYTLAGVAASEPERIQALCLAARSYAAEQRHREARPLVERALGMCRQAGLNEEVMVLIEMGDMARMAGVIYEAEEHYRSSLILAEQKFGFYAPETGTACHRLAMLAESVDDPGSFERHARRAYEIRSSVFGPTHPLAAAAQAGVASVLEACGETGEAGVKYLYALAIFDRHYAAPTPGECAPSLEILGAYAFCLHGACRKLLAEGRTEDAHEFSTRAQHVFERFLGKRHPQVKLWRKAHDGMLRTHRLGLGRWVRCNALELWRTFAQAGANRA